MHCPTGKARHERKSHAKRALRKLMALGTVKKLHVYRCKFCGMYHVGTKPGANRTNNPAKAAALRLLASQHAENLSQSPEEEL